MSIAVVLQLLIGHIIAGFLASILWYRFGDYYPSEREIGACVLAGYLSFIILSIYSMITVVGGFAKDILDKIPGL